MHRVPRLISILAALLLFAAACSPGTEGDGGDTAGDEAAAAATDGGGEQVAQSGDEEAVEIIVVTHGQATDPFWSVVKNGVDQAAADFGADVSYQAPASFDMVQMSQLIEGAIAQQPDGLAVSIPDADALRGPITRAVEAGIPVVSLNSGAEVAQDLGVIAHVGQSEELAGFQGGERLAEAGVTNGLCVNHEQGNVALELRCQGFQDAIEEAGGSVAQLAVNGNDPTDAQQRVEAAIQENPDINGGLAVGPLGMGPTLAALETLGALGEQTWGSFDLGSEILQAVAAGDLFFAIDQQQYLQGYLPVQFLTQNARIGVSPVETVLTGPSFVTQDEAEQVIDLTEQGIR